MDDQHIAYEKLVAFAAGELDGAVARGVAVHIALCPECARTVTRFKTIAFLMRTDDSQEPPPAVIAKARAIFSRRRSVPLIVKRRISAISFLPSLRQFSTAALLVLFILSNILACTLIGNVVVASQDAIPGDSLYPMKLTIEGIELAASLDTESKLDRHIAFAGFRVNELGALVTIERVAEIPNTLAAFENEVDQVSITFKTLVRENYQRAKALGPKVEAALSQYSTTLGSLRGIATAAVRPAFDNAIAICDTSRSTVNQLYLQPSTSAPSATPAPSLTFTSKPSAARSATPSPSRVIPPVASSTPAAAPANTVGPGATTRPTVAPANTVGPSATTRPTVAPSNTLVPPVTVAPTPTQFIPPGQLKKTPTPGAP